MAEARRLSNSIARVALVAAGIAAGVWTIAVFPTFLSENLVLSVSRAIIAGEFYRPEVLADIEAKINRDRATKLRASMLGKAVLVPLRRVENAIRAGGQGDMDQNLESLTLAIDDVLMRSPHEPLLWLVRFWLENTRNGLQ